MLWLKTAMSTQPGRNHISSSTPSLDGKGGTDSVSKDRKSMKRTGPSYGAPISRKLDSWLQWPNLPMQCITVYTPNSVHSNQITPSTTTTVSLAAFPQNCFPLLIQWRLLSGPCATLRTFWSLIKLLSSRHSQAQHPKKTLPASLCTLLRG